MDFDLSAEQVMLRDSVRRFGDEHYPATERLRMLAQDGAEQMLRWRTMAELGWLGLLAPEAYGGQGGSAVDVMVVMEGFGRRLMLEPYAANCVFAPALLKASVTELAQTLLRGLAAGLVTVAPAIAEPDGGFNLNHVGVTATPDATGFRLSGTKSHAEDGADADWYVVPARTSGDLAAREGVSLFLIHKEAANLRVERYGGIDHHRHACLHLDAVFVDRMALVGAVGEGLPLLEMAVDHVIAAHLAEAVGAIDALRDTCLQYLKTRRQFGTTIGSFQVLQHRMVDIDIACEEARSMMYHATLNLDRPAIDRRRAVSAAKARVGQCALFVGRQAVQLHGGLGMSAELIVSHYLKRIMMIDVAYGNAEHHKEMFASAA